MRKLLIDLPPQTLRKSRALSRGRYRNLQIAPAHHRAKKKIAVGNVVHAVTKNVALNRPAVNRAVYLMQNR